MLLQCPNCSVPLPVYTPFPFINPQTLSDKRGDEYLNGLLWNLAYIGKLKSSLPLQLRGFCNALLFVQIRDLEVPANGSEHFIVTAGTSTLIPKIGVICRDNSWDIIKYEPGDWEKLVEPSMEIVVWLVKRGGIVKQEEKLFNRAIKDFHKSGRLELF